LKKRLGLGPRSSVFEIASNDGYLLQHSCRWEFPSLASSRQQMSRKAAIANKVPTLVEFFGLELAHRWSPKAGEQI